MKSNYLPMILLLALVIAFTLFEKDKGNDAKFHAVANSQLEVAPFTNDSVTTKEEVKARTNNEDDLIMKCKKETATKADDLDSQEKDE